MKKWNEIVKESERFLYEFFYPKMNNIAYDGVESSEYDTNSKEESKIHLSERIKDQEKEVKELEKILKYASTKDDSYGTLLNKTKLKSLKKAILLNMKVLNKI